MRRDPPKENDLDTRISRSRHRVSRQGVIIRDDDSRREPTYRPPASFSVFGDAVPDSVWDVALLAAVPLVSGGRRCPLDIQTVAKSSQGATFRSYELSAACF